MRKLYVANGGWNLEWWFVMAGKEEVARFKSEAAAKRYVETMEKRA